MLFFNDTATTEIYTLSLHDALPIFGHVEVGDDEVGRLGDQLAQAVLAVARLVDVLDAELLQAAADRKSTRLNSSHANISYAVFCLKKKNNTNNVSVKVQRNIKVRSI